MRSLLFALCPRRATGSPSVGPSDGPRRSSPRPVGPAGVGDDALARMLLDFFRTRLRADPALPLRPGLPGLLVRRTLDRLAHRHAAEDPSGAEGPTDRPRTRKAEVLRAALLTLRALDASSASCPDGPALVAGRH